MNKIKQEKGITMVMLVIIVIALMIIAGVAINMGEIDMNATLDSKLEGELKMVQYAVFQQYAKYKTTLNEEDIIYTRDYNSGIIGFLNKYYNGQQPVHTPDLENDEVYKKYYLITPDDLIAIGIQDSEYSYIINYYTGEVFNASKSKTSEGNYLYVKGLNSTENSESF